jgi:hypothetical protein
MYSQGGGRFQLVAPPPPLLKLQDKTAEWQPLIDFEILSHAINECVQNGQQQLKQAFDHK